uniref:Uncharacterized protein n=1 Tax=Arundo donax TaxID=35708 RepID=A0A0A9BXQ5_ARUDO
MINFDFYKNRGNYYAYSYLRETSAALLQCWNLQSQTQ